MRIQQADLAERKRRHQSLRVCRDLADANRHTHCACGQRLQLATPIADSRHNEKVNSTPRQPHQQPHAQHRPQQGSGQGGRPFQGPGGVQQRWGHQP